ncbi:60S ribosomal protein L23, mitochondrial precursor [Lodderomyces elongisporus NRRL YB-4239]|uniref:Large ribosomal subunit protein uL13m n=1 Tax=Lodderomyces elongisporus (strain ATCC 11503 / CBS 2605 / JCM 1781 / NBRC 1676 / NRRL YB-4239) TaxID=379508 RepID=A5DVP3_LODEL|nr:60S ribosomal protein L23, mitochondrial precursor [Lodderomyces elongisporus NRRL YB-4239]
MSQKIGTAVLALTRVWHHVDVAADDRTLGRLASQIAITLQGKHKPTFTPNRDHGDYVVVTNCAHLKITGNKLKDKTYWSHTTRPGSLNLIPMERMIANKGYGEVLRRAVKGMIPKNKHRLVRMNRLRLYDGDEHPYKENLIAFADEVQDMKQKLAELEKKETERAGLREKYLSRQ